MCGRSLISLRIICGRLPRVNETSNIWQPFTLWIIIRALTFLSESFKPFQDSLPVNSFKHLVSFCSSSPSPTLKQNIVSVRCCMATNALRPGLLLMKWLNYNFFLSLLTVLTGGDRNRSQLAYTPKPHLRDSISAVTLYYLISQDVKLSLRGGERLGVYCSPVGNETVSDG
jgi:hypothetical protein